MTSANPGRFTHDLTFQGKGSLGNARHQTVIANQLRVSGSGFGLANQVQGSETGSVTLEKGVTHYGAGAQVIPNDSRGVWEPGVTSAWNSTAPFLTYTTESSDYLIPVDLSTAAGTVNLDSAAAYVGQLITVTALLAGGANSVTINPTAGALVPVAFNTIGGATEPASATWRFDGTNWVNIRISASHP